MMDLAQIIQDAARAADEATLAFVAPASIPPTQEEIDAELAMLPKRAGAVRAIDPHASTFGLCYAAATTDAIGEAVAVALIAAGLEVTGNGRLPRGSAPYADVSDGDKPSWRMLVSYASLQRVAEEHARKAWIADAGALWRDRAGSTAGILRSDLQVIFFIAYDAPIQRWTAPTGWWTRPPAELVREAAGGLELPPWTAEKLLRAWRDRAGERAIIERLAGTWVGEPASYRALPTLRFMLRFGAEQVWDIGLAEANDLQAAELVQRAAAGLALREPGTEPEGAHGVANIHTVDDARAVLGAGTEVAEMAAAAIRATGGATIDVRSMSVPLPRASFVETEIPTAALRLPEDEAPHLIEKSYDPAAGATARIDDEPVATEPAPSPIPETPAKGGGSKRSLRRGGFVGGKGGSEG